MELTTEQLKAIISSKDEDLKENLLKFGAEIESKEPTFITGLNRLVLYGEGLASRTCFSENEWKDWENFVTLLRRYMKKECKNNDAMVWFHIGYFTKQVEDILEKHYVDVEDKKIRKLLKGDRYITLYVILKNKLFVTAKSLAVVWKVDVSVVEEMLRNLEDFALVREYVDGKRTYWSMTAKGKMRFEKYLGGSYQ